MDKYSILKKLDNLIAQKDYINARKLIRNDLKRYGTKEEYYMYMGLASTDAEERLKNYQKAYEEKNYDAFVDAFPDKYDDFVNVYGYDFDNWQKKYYMMMQMNTLVFCFLLIEY